MGEWFPVEGGIDAGENPDEAVLRELREETELVPQACYRESIRIVPSKPAPVRIHIYAGFVSRGTLVVLNEEHTEFRWCSFAGAFRLLSVPAQCEALIRVRSRFLESTPPARLRIG